MKDRNLEIMDIYEAIGKRKSVRSYETTSIPKEIVIKVLEAARAAPSAGNIQPWHFIVVENVDKRGRIAKGGRYGRFIAKSPIVIVACGDKKASPRWYVVDTAIALEHLILAATAFGLGTCWVGSFNDEEVRRMLKIPDNFEIIALVALGYSGKKMDIPAKILHLIRPERKLKDIVSSEVYGEKLSI